MRYEDEEYVRLYTRDTATWKLLGWEGRTVLLHMLRGNFDRAGVFEVGGMSRNVTDSHEMSRLSRSVRAVTDLPEEVVVKGLEQVLREGIWKVTECGLVWPSYLVAQTCARSDRARKQAERARRTEEANRSAASRNVTDSHEMSQASRNVTPEPYRSRSLTGANNDLSSSLPTSSPTPPHSADAEAPTSEQPSDSKLQRRALARQVFEAWRQDTGHHRSKLDRKRQARIEARLRDGYSAEELIAAITHRRNDPFLMGGGPDGRVFDGIETLLRDAAQVERLRDLTAPPKPPPLRGPGPVQRDHGTNKFFSLDGGKVDNEPLQRIR